MVELEVAKKRWRTHTKKVITDQFLNAFAMGEVWGTYEYEGEDYTSVVTPDGWYLICYGEDANGNVFGFFPEDAVPIDKDKWKNLH